jgi:hypothetical protein
MMVCRHVLRCTTPTTIDQQCTLGLLLGQQQVEQAHDASLLFNMGILRQSMAMAGCLCMYVVSPGWVGAKTRDILMGANQQGWPWCSCSVINGCRAGVQNGSLLTGCATTEGVSCLLLSCSAAVDGVICAPAAYSTCGVTGQTVADSLGAPVSYHQVVCTMRGSHCVHYSVFRMCTTYTTRIKCCSWGRHLSLCSHLPARSREMVCAYIMPCSLLIMVYTCNALENSIAARDTPPGTYGPTLIAVRKQSPLIVSLYRVACSPDTVMSTRTAACVAVLLLGIAQQACWALDHDLVPEIHGKGSRIKLALHPGTWQPYKYVPTSAAMGQARYPGAQAAAGYHHHYGSHAHRYPGMHAAMHTPMELDHLPMMMSDSKVRVSLEPWHNRLCEAAAGAAQCTVCTGNHDVWLMISRAPKCHSLQMRHAAGTCGSQPCGMQHSMRTHAASALTRCVLAVICLQLGRKLVSTAQGCDQCKACRDCAKCVAGESLVKKPLTRATSLSPPSYPPPPPPHTHTHTHTHTRARTPVHRHPFQPLPPTSMCVQCAHA